MVSCQKLKPETVAVPEYPDFSVLMEEQIQLLGTSEVKKVVSLDGNLEERIMQMDSGIWVEELSFMKEVNPNQPEYVGAFEKSSSNGFEILTLGSGESGSVLLVKYAKTDVSYSNIEVTLHEDKDVYVHHRNVQLFFEGGVLNRAMIDGYQKVMFKDTIRFSISIEVQ